MNTKWLVLSLVLMLVGMTTLAHGTPPMETLQKPMNEIIRILKDPQYREKDKKEVKNKLSELLEYKKEWIYGYSERIFRLSEKFDEYIWQEFHDILERYLSRNKRDLFALHGDA